MTSYVVTLDGCQPPSTNEWLGKHWRRRWEDKQSIEHHVILVCNVEYPDIPRPIPEQVDIWITVFNRKRTLDADRVPIPAFVDGLRHCGILKDDTSQYVRWAGSRCAGDDGEARVVIEINEVTT